MTTTTVSIERLTQGALLPTKAHQSDAAYDLYADHSQVEGALGITNGEASVWLQPGACMPIHTGIAIELPPGLAALVLPRSGLAAKHTLTIQNAPGLIDSGYRGEIIVLLRNEGNHSYPVRHHDRIAQLLITRLPDVELAHVDRLSTSDRGSGGFGSTGMR